MPASPTISVSSGQTRYFDALDMQSTPHTDNGNGEGPRTSSRPEASANLSEPNQPSDAEGTSSPSKHAGQKTPSLRSLPVESENQEKHVSGMRTIFGSSLARKESVRTNRSTHTTRTASAFANGAPLTGPDAEPDVDETLFVRGEKAERSLTQKQKDRIAKQEKRESRKFGKLLKTDSSNEKVALDSALRNLSTLQGLHKEAIKRETRAEASHAKALSAAQKAESRFHEEKARMAEVRARAEARCIEERARWEGKQGELQAQQERLSSTRETVRETEIRITECAREVERLRVVKAMDEREREAKLTELVGQ